MVWLEFLISSAVIVLAATQLAKYGDIIAIRTRLGGMFVGLLLMAGATSLPEVLTTFNSISQGVPNLAAGNLLGSNMFNMVMLAIVDMAGRQQRILRKAMLKHSLTGSLTVFMIGLAIFFILADIDLQIGWVGVDSIVLILVYVLGVYLIQKNDTTIASVEEEIPEKYPSLLRGIIGFGIAAGVLVAGLVESDQSKTSKAG